MRAELDGSETLGINGVKAKSLAPYVKLEWRHCAQTDFRMPEVCAKKKGGGVVRGRRGSKISKL